MNTLKSGGKLLKRDEQFLESGSSAYTVDERWLAGWVGIAAIALPCVLIITTFWQVCFHYSISHFFYTGLPGTIFVLVLSGVGMFLLAYRQANKFVTSAAQISGVAAFLVALFPTSGDGCDDPTATAMRPFASLQGLDTDSPLFTKDPPSFLMSDLSPWIHYVSAMVVFGFLTLYCLCVLTQMDDLKYRSSGGELTTAKKARNTIYYICGYTMLSGMLALLAYWMFEFEWWNDYKLTFVAEAMVLVPFGIAWLLKGRFVPGVLQDPVDRRKAS
jgi:hypothetical protein